MLFPYIFISIPSSQSRRNFSFRKKQGESILQQRSFTWLQDRDVEYLLVSI